jgi:hypothetical protein
LWVLWHKAWERQDPRTPAEVPREMPVLVQQVEPAPLVTLEATQETPGTLAMPPMFNRARFSKPPWPGAASEICWGGFEMRLPTR